MEYRSTLPLADSQSPIHDTSPTNLAEARDKFVSLLGQENVATDPELCHPRSGSAWSPALSTQAPDIVVFPSSTTDVSDILKVCHSQNIPVYGYSGGTGLGGANVSTRRGICIDFKRMDKIGVLHEDDMDITVQPGVGWQELNTFLSDKGLFFPPDPAPGAKIGGMIAMSCSGTNAYRYGTMKEWVISLTVVLADGSIVKTRNRPRKSSAGYDLTHLIIGSEGTLGIVTEAVLKLTRAPQNLHVAIATFPTTSAAVNAAITVIKSGHYLDAIEFVDKESIVALNRMEALSDSKMTWEETPTLFLKFSGSDAVVSLQVNTVRGTARENDCIEFRASSKEEDITKWWGARKAVGKALVGMKNTPSDLFITADAAVPISRLAEIIDDTHRVTKNLGLFCSTIGHIGDGNVHTAIVCPAEQGEVAEKVIKHVQRKALELEGTVTGEHGVGLHVRDMLVEEMGHTGVDLMRKIKLALDPKAILNPDKVFHL
ncbi:MAG: D-lactate ferricytochrome c oxidoreductase [Bogoriella megaspora]|nr:MAG: D-lactate ferricytochrome c oxidoreductase [Bogoriella megaspora]